jgi:hypothetical protein
VKKRKMKRLLLDHHDVLNTHAESIRNLRIQQERTTYPSSKEIKDRLDVAEEAIRILGIKSLKHDEDIGKAHHLIDQLDEKLGPVWLRLARKEAP